MRLSPAYLCVLFGALHCPPPLQGQFIVKLAPETVKAFDDYAAGVEAELQQRWQGKRSFLALEDDGQALRNVLKGELWIKALGSGKPAEVKNGLIHDWIGAVFIPNVTSERVLDVLRDFDAHKKIYPSVADSRLVRRSGDEVTGYWRLKQKAGVVPVVLDVEQEAHYRKLGPGKWSVQAFAKDIREIDSGLFASGRKFPPGEGHGYLWRLFSYWSLEEYQGGVLAECRTLSLSRDIPEGLGWAVRPYVEKTPRQSLASTLSETRRTAARPSR